MKVRELAETLRNLPQDQQDLEVYSIEELYVVSVLLPRLMFIDKDGKETKDPAKSVESAIVL